MDAHFLHDYNLYNINMSAKEIILSFEETFTETPQLYNIHLLDVQHFFGSELKQGNIVLDIEILELAKITPKDFDRIFVRQSDGCKVNLGDYREKYIFYLYCSYGCDIKAIVKKICLTRVVNGQEEILSTLL